MQSEKKEAVPGYETSLVILVPDAEPVVSPFRQKYDPSAPQGMPAHITINYPFQADIPSYPELYAKLDALFSKYPPIQFSLVSINQFPGVLYLEPAPVYPFIDLIQSVATEFPESPPYKGEFSEAIPHLTVAQSDIGDEFKKIKSRFIEASIGDLPVQIKAKKISLMNNKSGIWKLRKQFPLNEQLASTVTIT